MTPQKRAYTDEEKQIREQKIIEAAEALFVEKGFYDINMAEIAERAGLAKDTVYRYFTTKEELFLAVFERYVRGWFREVQHAIAALDEHAAPEALVEALIETTRDKAEFTKLLALKYNLLDHNISVERAQKNIVWMQLKLKKLGQLIADTFEVQLQQGINLLRWMLIFIIGLEGMAHPAPIVKEIYDSEPDLTAIDFESELRNFLLAIIRAW